MRMRDYSDNPNMIKTVGMRQLDELARTAEAIPAQPCPFCGSSPEVRLSYIFMEYANIFIACSSCGIQTPKLLEGTTFPTGHTYTLKDRLLEAVQLWSRRV